MYAGVQGDNTQYTIEPVSVSKNGKPTDLTFTASAPLSFNTLTGLADASNSDIKLTFSNNGTASDAIEGVDLRVIGESETSPVLTMDASGITMFSEKTNLNSELGINGLGKGKAVGKMTSVGVDSSGYIVASYSNGVTKNIGQIAVASFSNLKVFRKKAIIFIQQHLILELLMELVRMLQKVMEVFHQEYLRCLMWISLQNLQI